MLEVIHYGSDQYSTGKFNPVGNRELFSKPRGGLWTSPVNSVHSWKDWCIYNDFHLDELKKSFTLLINKGARILIINDVTDLINLPKIDYSNTGMNLFCNYYDFEKIAEEYDAIHLTARGEVNTRITTMDNLYGWDCETVFIMNPKCFTIV